MLSKQMRNS